MNPEDEELSIFDLNNSQKQYREEKNNEQFAEVMQTYIRVLSEYGVCIDDLLKVSPKHRDSKQTLFRVTMTLIQHPQLIAQLKKHKLLPIKELELTTGVKRKVLEKGRKYIIALTLILSEPEAIRDHDPKEVLSENHMHVRDLFPGECTEIRSTMQSSKNESSSNSLGSEMKPKLHDDQKIKPDEHDSSSMHNNQSNGTSEDQHNSSTNSSNSTPQSSNQQNSTTTPNTTNEDHRENWNQESEHNGDSHSSEPMDPLQDLNHNSDWSKHRS